MCNSKHIQLDINQMSTIYPPTKHIAISIFLSGSADNVLKKIYEKRAQVTASVKQGPKASSGTTPFNLRSCFGLSSKPALVRMIPKAITLSIKNE